MKTDLRMTLIAAFAVMATQAVTFQAFAEETTSEKISEGAQDNGKAIKKGYRNVKDKTCEMINGKLECLAKGVKHKAQNAGDEVSDKANDLKKKVD